MNFPSRLIEEAVNEISRLPGIGKKTALRLALHLLKEEPEVTNNLAAAITNLRSRITYCQKCHNIADEIICSICNSQLRDRSILCVVEDSPDLLAIENTNQFRGMYHVLGGVISPMEGIGPSELRIETLLQRISEGEIREVILALSPSMEGDTTAFYLTRKLKDSNVKITAISRGVAIGSELEYTDEVTLGRSILTRTDYQTEQS
jgi:recombination protein RecR